MYQTEFTGLFVWHQHAEHRNAGIGKDSNPYDLTQSPPDVWYGQYREIRKMNSSSYVLDACGSE